MILNPQKTRYPAIEHLEVQNAKDHPIESLPAHVQFTYKTNGVRQYGKNEIFKRIGNYLMPTQPANTHVDSIIAKYFTYSLNPIYEKISKLPQQIFICGYCKEIYYGPSEYLLHCFEVDCPVNHDRSTYFFHFKNKFSQIKNVDIGQTLNVTELNQFRSISYRKKALIFTDFQVKPLKKDSSEWMYCGKCKIRRKFSEGMFAIFYINHCFFVCKSIKTPTNSHALIPIEHKQDLVGFIDDIINLVVNFNIIALFNDSYVRLEKNPKLGNSNTYTHFCANCKSNFSNETYFIQHCLFECKQRTNPKSSHLFNRKKVKQPFSGKKIKFESSKEIPQEKKKLPKKEKKNAQEKKKDQIQEQNARLIESKKWKEEINPEFTDFKDLLQNIYFCGQCNSNFQDDQSYLMHCLSCLCPLNQPRNSHFFYQKDSEEKLTIKTLQIFASETKKSQPSEKFKDNPQLEKTLKEYIQVVNRLTKQVIKPGKVDDYHCGKCKQGFKKQHLFIFHCLKTCYSQNHEMSSHIIRFSKNKMIKDEQFKDCLLSYLYAVQILKFCSTKKYRVTKNEFIDAGEDYLCGKCDTLFGNLYEYVLHSISVCANMRSKYSSHFVGHTIVKSPSQIKWPLNVVFTENFNSYSWNKGQTNNIDNGNEEKIGKPQPMQIQVDQPHNNARMQVQSQQKQERQMKEDEDRHNLRILEIQGSEKIWNGELPRFLRPNIDFERKEKQKYYCGSCEISFRKEQDFKEHLEECNSFENPSSSHFLLTNYRYEQIYSNNILLTSNCKPVPREIPGFRNGEYERFICGCGQQGLLRKYSYHLKSKHDGEVQTGSSHIILRLVYYKWKNKVLPVPLPVDGKGISPEQEFFCPCDPWKKYKYAEFVNHIIRRHQGKSPKFWMRLDGQE